MSGGQKAKWRGSTARKYSCRVAGHTFLFREGTWRAAGEYRDGAGTATPVDGETRVRHEAGRWVSEGVLHVRGKPPQEHRTAPRWRRSRRARKPRIGPRRIPRIGSLKGAS